MKRKIWADIGVTVALPLLMAYGLIGEAAHEWIGMGMFVLFLLHLVWNKKWFGAVGKGRYAPARVVQTVLNGLIFLCMIGCMVSGILLSKYLFTFLPDHGGYELWEKMHILCSFWGFALMCLHLGTHWGMLLTMLRKKWKLPQRGQWYLQMLGYLAAICGIPAFLRRDVWDYLTLRSHFVFYDYTEPVTWFLRDYLLMMILFVTLGHEGMKLLRKRKKGEGNGMKRKWMVPVIVTVWVIFFGYVYLLWTVQNLKADPASGTVSVPTTPETQAPSEETQPTSLETVTPGTETYRDFLIDNVLHSNTDGDIHYNVYIPESYDGTKPYALYVTLPGYEGLYFQGVARNLQSEAFGFEAQKYNSEMIILAPQLSDWGETSANQTIALVEYFLQSYNIDPNKVYANGYSGGGETMSIVMGKRPDLFTAYLQVSSQWDGAYEPVVEQRVPVYFAIGRNDEYYGSQPTQRAYDTLHELYREEGLPEEGINRLLILDIKDHDYFAERNAPNEHGGGGLFAYDEEIMGWLFSRERSAIS